MAKAMQSVLGASAWLRSWWWCPGSMKPWPGSFGHCLPWAWLQALLAALGTPWKCHWSDVFMPQALSDRIVTHCVPRIWEPTDKTR